MLMRTRSPLPQFEDGSRRFRTIFLSDIHLGMKGCQADRLLDFLRVHDAETMYLVGDVVDGWLLKSNWHWPQNHNDVVQKALRKARKGTRLFYVTGNHDEFLRDYVGAFGSIEIVDSAIHIGVDGRQHLVVHGDHFDLVVRQARWLAVLGGHAYDAAVVASRHLNVLRRWLGFPYWSLSHWAKAKVKNAASYIADFENTLCEEARKQGANGVICGHIHHATIGERNGISYMNCGDWVESCTALVEHYDGRFEIIAWNGEEYALEAAAMRIGEEARP